MAEEHFMENGKYQTSGAAIVEYLPKEMENGTVEPIKIGTFVVKNNRIVQVPETAEIIPFPTQEQKCEALTISVK